MLTRTIHAGDLFEPRDPALDQLGRLNDGWGRRLRPDQPIHALALAVARDLRAAGFELHDCALETPTGGVCLLPSDPDNGVIVTWAEHDVLVNACDLYGVYVHVLETMNHALAVVLSCMGWCVEPLGEAGAYVVRDRMRVGPATRSDDDP